MFVAMNNFDVVPEREADFEQIWLERESHLQEVPGFVEFALLRGDTPGRYISHSSWQSEEAFHDWTRSEAFAKGHQQGSLKGILAGPPVVATFESVVHETPTSRAVTASKPDGSRQGFQLSH